MPVIQVILIVLDVGLPALDLLSQAGWRAPIASGSEAVIFLTGMSESASKSCVVTSSIERIPFLPTVTPCASSSSRVSLV